MSFTSPSPYAAPSSQPAHASAAGPYTAPPSVPPAPAAWAPAPRPRASKVAVAALVVSIVALVGVVVLGVLVAVSGLFALGGSDVFTSYETSGTAPGVVAGQPYAGDLLETELTSKLEDNFSTVDRISCPDTPVVEAGAVTVCEGDVDGYDEVLTVTFRDASGTYDLLEEW